MSDQQQPTPPEPGVRYIVARISEVDLRTLIYAPHDEGRWIRVTHEQHTADLNPEDLRRLGLWDEAKALAESVHQPPVERCHTWFGERADKTKGSTCLRAHGHPPISEDGVGHSASARHQGL